jgi:hypothetical protein
MASWMMATPKPPSFPPLIAGALYAVQPLIYDEASSLEVELGIDLREEGDRVWQV